ncbi:cytosolic Fe-S cluster assembly factor NUBP2 isoform X2 [Ovis canadensis]|uniref:cytosolic Fe-S cluster assembly factor NUBP2 isoform X2 n=1 Tax=Ovis canadensis TaxID=37174 RepID=UPI0037534F95
MEAAAEPGNLAGVRHIVLVLSGKGGVGKSTISTELALALRHAGKKVGILDVDLCGPSVPRMLRVQGRAVHQGDSGWVPVFVDREQSISLMSMGFLLEQPDEAVVWRGPKKNALIKQFVSDVAWGQLDYLVVDTPPGTSDEHMAVVDALRPYSPLGALVVTTPQVLFPHRRPRPGAGSAVPSSPICCPCPFPGLQAVSVGDVRRELTFCRKVGLRVIGLVENMSGFVCPHCSARCPWTPSSRGAWRMAGTSSRTFPTAPPSPRSPPSPRRFSARRPRGSPDRGGLSTPVRCGAGGLEQGPGQALCAALPTGPALDVCGASAASRLSRRQ